MPVRLLNSPVLKWPDARQVTEGVRQWAERIAMAHPEVLRVGYFGSYARGDWGVGSDLDLIMVVSGSDQPFDRRSAQWDTTGLPVPADLVVYTTEEWDHLMEGGRFASTVVREAIWVYVR